MQHALAVLALLAALASAGARPLSLDEIRALYPFQPVAPATRSFAALSNATTLRAAAAQRGIFVGTAINNGCLGNHSDPLYVSTFAQQYDLSTAENECKFAETEPAQGVFSLAACDAILSNSTATGAVMRLHNMVWGNNNPNWLLNGNFSSDELVSIMQTHIRGVMGHYAAQKSVVHVDVVNEAVCDPSDCTFKPAAPWYPAVPNYVDLAFQTAASVQGDMLLFYNDYGGEDMGSKSDRIYAMVQSMKQRGIPIDGVGLQMHVSVANYPNPSDVAANMKRLGALGLKVAITEMDVRCDPAPCNATQLERQAGIYAAMLGACLSVPACVSFETWGFTDLHTWLWTFNNPTHVNLMPLPFDVNYNAKPAFDSLLNLLNAAPIIA